MPPIKGAVLVVTNEQGFEVIFGFFQYPATIRDAQRKVVAEVGLKGCWAFRDHVKSGDECYRKIVKRFEAEGYLAEEMDEFE